MKQCILTIGVSGSGKSTWAREFVNSNRDWVYISRDDIRFEIFKKKENREFRWDLWSWKFENEVSVIWKERVAQHLGDKRITGIIIADTNLSETVRKDHENFFESRGFVVLHKHFPIEFHIACQNDLKRTTPVGAKVIANQMVRYWSQFEKQYVGDPQNSKAVIVDVDGTLAHKCDRGIYDYTKVSGDFPDPFVVPVVVGLFKQGYKVVIVSGRDDNCYIETWQWLYENLGVFPHALLMRKTGDKRSDSVVKKEIFWDYIAHWYNVIGVIDDRPKVVNMWLSMGLKTLACGFQALDF